MEKRAYSREYITRKYGNPFEWGRAECKRRHERTGLEWVFDIVGTRLLFLPRVHTKRREAVEYAPTWEDLRDVLAAFSPTGLGYANIADVVDALGEERTVRVLDGLLWQAEIITVATGRWGAPFQFKFKVPEIQREAVKMANRR